MWQVVYIAPNESIATMIKEYLTQEGFLVMLRSSGIPHMGASASYEVLVPEAEAEEVMEIINTIFQAGGGV